MHSGEGTPYSGGKFCLTVAAAGTACYDSKAKCLAITPCDASNADQGFGIKIIVSGVDGKEPHENVRITHGGNCVAWKNWGSPLVLTECKSKASLWQRTASRLVRAQHIDAYRSFSDVYQPVPPAYLR